MSLNLETLLYTSFLFLSVIISAFSQVLLKKSALKEHSSKLKEYLNPYVISGYAIFFAAVFLDMLALKKVPVSFIPIVESSSYVFIIIFSKIFFNEKVSVRKILSITVIFTGLVIYIL